MTLLPFDAALVRKRLKMLGRRGEPEKEALGLVKLSSFSQRCTLLLLLWREEDWSGCTYLKGQIAKLNLLKLPK